VKERKFRKGIERDKQGYCDQGYCIRTPEDVDARDQIIGCTHYEDDDYRKQTVPYSVHEYQRIVDERHRNTPEEKGPCARIDATCSEVLIRCTDKGYRDEYEFYGKKKKENIHRMNSTDMHKDYSSIIFLIRSFISVSYKADNNSSFTSEDIFLFVVTR